MTLEVSLLGPIQVRLAGRLVELPGDRLPALLAVLAMSAGEAVSVDRLASAVWGEDPAVDARTNVQTNIRRLRRLLGDDSVVTRGGRYALRIEPDQVDALRFVRLLDLAAAAKSAKSAEDRETERNLLVEAVELWRGDSDWLEPTQLARLQERYLAAVERCVDLDLTSEAGVDLVELIEHHPLRESLWVRLLKVLQQSGRSAEALERYETIRVLLAEELGTDPGPELREVYQGLLAGTGMQRPAPHQLPADTRGFTGREAELKALDQAAAISAITGTAGIGKTALAVHWAHRVADRFPDGQLYVNLCGFDPARPPMAPAEALRGFLDALQVSPQAIPVGLEAQAGLYRSLLAGKRLLVLLDNARDAGQVVPLLPGAAGCLVLVTSRNQLPGLVAATGAQSLTLDLLDRVEAVHLLASRLGRGRIDAEPAATQELVSRCAGLPLALAIIAARAATQPDLSLTQLAEQLRDLDGFATPDPASDARAVFSWSYHSLTPPAAGLFRLFGLHPGPDVSLAAIASLAGHSVDRTRRLLTELTHAHLITEHSPGRYATHDLLSAYARELADSDEIRTAHHRMLDHYVHTAHHADLELFRHGESLSLGEPQAGVFPEQLSGYDQATAWFSAERRVLLAMIELATDNGFDRDACELAWALFVFLHRQGHWHDRVTTQHAAHDAAQRLGDADALSRSDRYLGFAYADLGRYDDAHRHLRHALQLSEDAGDLAGQAWTHYYLDLIYGQQGRIPEALDAAQQALHLFEATDNRIGQAIALTDVGWYQGRLGNDDQAAALCERALVMHQDLDNRTYQAHTWSCLGEIHVRRGDLTGATGSYQRAVELFREVGDRYGEASALAYLGDLHNDAGDPVAAREAWLQARAIVGDLDQPAADQIRINPAAV